MTGSEAELHLLPSALAQAVRPDYWLDVLLEMAERLAEYDFIAAASCLERMNFLGGLTDGEYDVFMAQLYQRRGIDLETAAR